MACLLSPSCPIQRKQGRYTENCETIDNNNQSGENAATTTLTTTSKTTNKSSEAKKKRPVDWSFQGYMAFVMFSKYAPNQSNCLTMLKGSGFGKADSASGRDSTHDGIKAGRNKQGSLQSA
ncbi:hypothetical protein ACA910_006850 [Epithemia clementina (nom. ined.)]